MTDDRINRVRHEYGSKGGGDYVQNVAEFDLALAEHDREVEARGLEKASNSGEFNSTVCIALNKRARRVREGKA